MAVPRPIRRFPRRFGLLAALSALIALVLGIVPAAASETAASETAAPAALSVADRGTAGTKPTIVLVHGAFADASGWNDVTENLQKKGYPVYAFANPLRSVSGDAEYLRLFLSTIPGPLVVVGHSYGGFVVTNGATGNPNVKALVYIAAYAPDEGETILAANALGGGHSDLGDHIIVRPYPGAPPGDADGYIDPAFFHDLFAQDLPRRQTAVMAASQRPAAVSLFVSPSGPPAWKTIPSWDVIGTEDHIIPPPLQEFMAKRAGSRVTDVKSSHLSLISHPKVVAGVIAAAAKHVH